MPRGGRWPSKWWFWGSLSVVTAHLWLGIALGFFLSPDAIRALPEPVLWFIFMPCIIASDCLGPCLAWILSAPESFTPSFWLCLGLGQALAVVSGLVCYGAAALVHAIVAGEGPSEQEADDASR